jgi:hypothetical protein
LSIAKVKFIFSKRAAKIENIFTALALLYTVKLTVKIFSIFLAFSENVNFIRMYEKVHLRSDFRKKVLPWLGLEPPKVLLW